MLVQENSLQSKNLYPIFKLESRLRDFFLNFLKSLQRHASPADWARELFKPSTDSASLQLHIKKMFSFWVWGFLGVTSQWGHVFAFWVSLPGLGAKPFLGSSFFETRLWSASSEPLIDLLAYLEPNLWLKNPVFHKIQKVSQNFFGF